MRIAEVKVGQEYAYSTNLWYPEDHHRIRVVEKVKEPEHPNFRHPRMLTRFKVEELSIETGEVLPSGTYTGKSLDAKFFVDDWDVLAEQVATKLSNQKASRALADRINAALGRAYSNFARPSRNGLYVDFAQLNHSEAAKLAERLEEL